MNITLEEFKKEVVKYLKDSTLMKSEAKNLGITPELFVECFLNTTGEGTIHLINEHYKRALEQEDGTSLSTVCGTLSYFLEWMLDDDDVEEIKTMLNIASSKE